MHSNFVALSTTNSGVVTLPQSCSQAATLKAMTSALKDSGAGTK